MNDNTTFDISTFTQVTRKSCMYCFISIFIIILFGLTPLQYYTKTSILMKLIAVILLSYTIYLNYIQTNLLKQNQDSENISSQIQTQLNMNIICINVFIIFLFMLTIFLIKSLF